MLPEPHTRPDHQPAAKEQEWYKHNKSTGSGHSSQSHNSQGNTSCKNQEYKDDHDYFQQGVRYNYVCYILRLRLMASALIWYLSISNR